MLYVSGQHSRQPRPHREHSSNFSYNENNSSRSWRGRRTRSDPPSVFLRCSLQYVLRTILWNRTGATRKATLFRIQLTRRTPHNFQHKTTSSPLKVCQKLHCRIFCRRMFYKWVYFFLYSSFLGQECKSIGGSAYIAYIWVCLRIPPAIWFTFHLLGVM